MIKKNQQKGLDIVEYSTENSDKDTELRNWKRKAENTEFHSVVSRSVKKDKESNTSTRMTR